MKHITLILAMLSFIVNYSIAQSYDTDFRSVLQFGLKAGTNYSNIYDTEGEELSADPKFGFVTGAFVAIPIGEFLGIQPEILFSQKGFKGSGILFGSPYELTRTSNYIDIPLLFSLKPSEYFSLVAGPQYSYLIKQKNSFSNAVTTIEQEREFDNEDLRKNTVCFTGGFDVSMSHFVFGGRVGWDLFKNNGDGTTTTPRYKNVWYQVTIGYRLYR